MNRFDDRLIAFAFGELGPEETARFEQELSRHPEWQAALDELRTLKGDLRRLQEVPECQLSTERMRDAILRREMDQRVKTGRRATWLVGPVASVAAMGTLWIVLQSLTPPSEPSPRVGSVSDPTTLAMRAASAPAPAVRKKATAPAAPAVRPSPTRNRKEREPMQIERTSPSVRLASRSVERPVAVETDAPVVIRPAVAKIVSTESVPETAMRPSGEMGLRTMESVPEQPTEATQREGIVIIRNERDERTGARTASEVQADDGIVFGG